MKRLVSLIFLCICLLPVQGLACTTFVLDDGSSTVVGKDFDYWSGDGLLIVNKRGVSKSTMYMPNEQGFINWTSKYGSVTFTFFSREMPFAGMNEAGLVIEAMMLTETEYPKADSRSAFSELQWVQYQLDNCSTVDEVIASDTIMRMPQPANPYERLHYLVTDGNGNCASIEWLDGKMVCHTGQTMPYKVLTNSTYDKSMDYIGWYKGFGGFLPISLSKLLIRWSNSPLKNSLPRFVCAADMIQKYDPKTSGPAIDYAIDILSSVTQQKTNFSPTQWSIVYDIPNLTVYFRTIGNDKLRYFNLSSFDFSCTTPVTALDVNADLSGDVSSSFIDYTADMGRELLKKSLSSLPEEAREDMATYPEKYTHCTE